MSSGMEPHETAPKDGGPVWAQIADFMTEEEMSRLGIKLTPFTTRETRRTWIYWAEPGLPGCERDGHWAQHSTAQHIMTKITQLTQEQAIAFAETKQWESWDAKTRAMFQFNQKYLCMPFDVFHKATEDALGRPVFTHEFALNHDGLLSELQGLKDAPTFEQIISLLPPDKTIVIST